jgi:fructan beta-fructosidase
MLRQRFEMSDYWYGRHHGSLVSRSVLRLTFVFCSWTLLAQTLEYDQHYRPQIHFSPRKNWTNDPNGLVYFRGEYHLFFQFNPFGIDWGHMSWGHAVSADLLHWRQLPIAIPEKDGEMVFTGSVVVDTDNTSGFCAPQPECLVAIYTGHRATPQETRQTQNLAYSTDNGRTWTRYAANPVIDLGLSDFRDPSVSWDDQWGHWLMAVSLPKEHKIRFYASSNLKQWSKLSDFGPSGDVDGDWECPDLLRIPVEGETRQIWALKIGLNPGAQQGGSGEQYFLGQFDGKSFTVSTQTGSHGWTNYGKDDYCAISFNGLPRNEKPVLIGWMSNWQYAAQLPTSPWRGQMSLPRKLSVLSDQGGVGAQARSHNRASSSR